VYLLLDCLFFNLDNLLELGLVGKVLPVVGLVERKVGVICG